MGKRDDETKIHVRAQKYSGASSSDIRIPSARETEAHIPPPNIPPLLPPVSPTSSLPDPPYDFANCPTRLNHNGPYFLPDVIAALRATRANFLLCSSLLGRRRNSIRDFVFANIEAKDVYDEEREKVVDQVEDALFDVAVCERDPASLRFLASTLGKDRGYTPKVEHTGSDGKPLAFEVTMAEGTSTAMTVLEQKQRTEEIMDDLLKRGLPLEKEH